MKKQIIEDSKTMDDLDVLDGLKSTYNEEEEECIQKPKKPRSEKQIIAFNLVLEKRNEKRKERALVKEQELAAEMQEIEAKIMKKAISIKKKEIKKHLILDEISDDDEPIQSIKAKITKSAELLRSQNKPQVAFDKVTKSPLHTKISATVPAPAPVPAVPKIIFM